MKAFNDLRKERRVTTYFTLGIEGVGQGGGLSGWGEEEREGGGWPAAMCEAGNLIVLSLKKRAGRAVPSKRPTQWTLNSSEVQMESLTQS